VTELHRGPSVPLEVVLEAQRTLMGSDSPQALAESTWALARRLAEVTAVRLYRRGSPRSELIVAVPPEDSGYDGPGDPCRQVLSQPLGYFGRSGVLTAWTPVQPSHGAVVIEHGGGDEPGLQAVAAIAAGALGNFLEIEREREQEQRRLAQVLHDGVVQDLAYIHLRLELLERSLAAPPDELKRMVTELQADLTAANHALRTAVGELRRAKRPRAPVKIAGDRADLERIVLGIVREALTNIHKHAGATDVRIEVAADNGELSLAVRDNGSGIQQPAESAGNGHFGISQMRELAAELGGNLSIERVPAGGTQVVAKIPVGLVEWVW
jgi:signal transduction histidine kinase